MNAQELAADSILGSGKMLLATLADFSDADMLVRPCPGANHATWQLGHVIAVQGRICIAMGAGDIHPMMAPDFALKFNKETSKNDDSAGFPSKAALMDLFTAANAATARFVNSLPDDVLSNPTPEAIRARIPDVGHAMVILSSHTTMHTGQMQVIRRRLGKPVLF